MKSPLPAVLVALQIVTLGLVVGLLLRRNEPAPNQELAQLTAALRGTLHQERIILGYLEELRAQAAGRGSAAAGIPDEPPAPRVAGGAEGGEAPAPPRAAAPSPAAADPSAPFPAAAAALAELKRVHRHLREEAASGRQNTGPLETELERGKSALIDRGHQALFVVRREVDLQPYEAERDVPFVEYLLEQVVPALSGGDKEAAFDIARGALVRQTNEAPLKFAAARALQAIDPNRWVKDVCDVIALGGSHETELRSRLLGLFEESPRPEAVELCRRFVEDGRQPPEMRTRAIVVLSRQESSAVNPVLRRVVFEDPTPILKIHALDGLWTRLGPDEQRKLAQDILDEDPARMPDSVQTKARTLLDQLEAQEPHRGSR